MAVTATKLYHMLFFSWALNQITQDSPPPPPPSTNWKLLFQLLEVVVALIKFGSSLILELFWLKWNGQWMASTSGGNQSPMSPLKEQMQTSGIPIIGGKELDLHRLFIEVTSRGGIEKGRNFEDNKIIRERRWKDVTAIFNFPSTATNASFVLRKYYVSLLHHYEQIYFFKARVWTPLSAGTLQSPPVPTFLAQQMEAMRPAQESKVPMTAQPRTTASDLRRASTAWPANSPVVGVIDGKFESGYLVTVSIGSEKLKGVLYQTPQSAAGKMPQQFNISINNNNVAGSSGIQRRRRRKKSEIKRRDPAHPKPNRSGYNFFFAEQHARLKPLHPGKDREISRMIGELWNKLNESERAVYQDKALKDKERYKMEMESYRERLRMGQVVSDAVPLQQRLPELDVDMVDADADANPEETEEGNSPQTQDNESSSDKSFSEEDDKDTEKELDAEPSPVSAVVLESSNLDVNDAHPEMDDTNAEEGHEKQDIAVENVVVAESIRDGTENVEDGNKEKLGQSSS
ncbi:high mobility group B protein 15 isoform X3 [Syzygium oleosum]|uniref:high mobility group B protein 15 isoform X3 n=1 Tax=Syzygium oleosum TaxID=219896 RepID=UPI0024BAD089|nr:high mobility group B protein 15 isoform X3 [Syzygium oleosum]